MKVTNFVVILGDQPEEFFSYEKFEESFSLSILFVTSCLNEFCLKNASEWLLSLIFFEWYSQFLNGINNYSNGLEFEPYCKRLEVVASE